MLIDDIVIGERYRKDAGDIAALAKSIDANGLMHLPVVTPTNELICGYRRLLALESLGRVEVDVRVIDPNDLLLAEHDENECRKQFTPSERVAIADAIKERLGVKQGQRPTSGQLPRSERPRDEAAKAAGFNSTDEYRRAKKVVEDGVPELVEAMDKGEVSPSAAATVAKLPKKEQKKVVKEKKVKEKAKQEREKKEPEIIAPVQVDEWDIPIQEHATEAFAAVPKFKELVSAIQVAQKLFNEVANLKGGLFLTLPDVSSYRRGKKTAEGHADRFVHEGLEKALKQVQNATPTHTVCPWHYVDGKHPEECGTCKGLNWTPVLGSNIPDMARERARKKFKVKED